MADLRGLYQELILDHGRRPRNFGPLPEANRDAEGVNPLCGDQLHLHLKVEDGRIVDLRFDGHGCAISTASASLMTQALKGRTVAEAEALFDAFHALMTGTPAPDAAPLGKLEVLAGVREFPTRIKCATLAWHTLAAALHGGDETVSTE
ncbi:SUF system NifU family Fe-S cluster assembly protein [Nitrogeniibacter mangrovi]|uniref:SUF system NifU family Fe-S cluster assembly protein n=1 Tax=Nitrogeniibacter mangrovi TaxID=2016596 RepID=A0A6C1AYG7_9RHOO|nr:SUF system NifU family Fe-S cluster assembly protein [Nitrogeniibacter mangrovi]QID16163.1 SUF system NifU family Fe-S cluster assembly protein [Nitrogeniibacter mangrovi]